MITTTPAPKPAPTRRRTAWFGAAVLLMIALLWRLPCLMKATYQIADELWYALPTAERFTHGEWLLYISGTNYGAPVQEFLASLLIRFFGVSVAALRLPVVVLGSLAVVVAYCSLRSVVRERVAFALGALLACANSAVGHYTAYAHPCYATIFLLVGVLQLLTFRLARERTAGGWWALALTMGVAFYVFKLSVLQSAASLAWLWWRSENAAQLRARAATPDGARRLWRAGAVLGAGALLLAPVAYRFLTRRATFAIVPWEKMLLAGALGVLVVGAFFAARALVRPGWRETWPALVCALALVLIPLPAALWHDRIEAPRVAARGGAIYAEKEFSLKHLHAWPHQVRLALQGVIPALIVGRFDILVGQPTETVPLDWRSGVSVVLLGAVGWFGGKRLRAGGWRVPVSAGDAVLIAPFLLTAAVMFPTWQLHSACCFRYLVPYLPGGMLLAYRALEEPLTRHPRLATSLVAGLILQSAYDCYRYME